MPERQGIMGELFLENQYRNIDGNPYIWDSLLLEKVMAEPNVELFLDTEVSEVAATDGHIDSVTGWMQGSERRLTFAGAYYIDCTGDGLIGFLSGAEYMLGREAQETFGESLAPEVADQELMGSTLLFYTKAEDKNIEFVAPAFAKDIAKTSILKNRVIRSGDSGGRYWWIEWGGEIDIVENNGKIRQELLSIIYGIWDYIKNSGNFDADNLTLEWVGTIPGKREYRRLTGDYILTQQDIEEQTEFEDRIAFGGWSIDLHPAQGIYNENGGAHHAVADGVYHLPYRMLYSKNVSNLFMAGRDISTSHVAFGGVRIMGTCATLGEAAGTAASLAIDKGCDPRGIYAEHLQEFQQLLLKNDASILGVKNTDEGDRIRQARIASSSNLKRINTDFLDKKEYPLETHVALSLPLDDQQTELTLSFLVTTTQPTKLTIEMWDCGKPQNYIPERLIEQQEVDVGRVSFGWVTALFHLTKAQAGNVFVIVRENEHASLYLTHTKYPGVLSYIYDVIAEMREPQLHQFTRESQLLYWTTQKVHNQNFVFKVAEATEAYSHENVGNGYQRPYGGTNMWVTEYKNKGEWLQFDFEHPEQLSEIRLTFNDDVNEDLINLHHHYTPNATMPELVKTYRLLYLKDKVWRELYFEEANRKRHKVIRLEQAVTAEALKLEILETNGSPFVSVVEVRAY